MLSGDRDWSSSKYFYISVSITMSKIKHIFPGLTRATGLSKIKEVAGRKSQFSSITLVPAIPIKDARPLISLHAANKTRLRGTRC